MSLDSGLRNYFLITSTGDICRSFTVCEYKNYQGAFVKMTTFSWNLCSISRLELLADFHSWITPKSSSGWLYIIIVYYSTKVGIACQWAYIFCSFIQSWFRLVNMCFFHVSLLSKCSPSVLCLFWLFQLIVI